MNDPRFRDRKPAAIPIEGGERLQKVLADAGVASRRDSEYAIRAGRVRVNGRLVLELPCLVDAANALIEFDGDVIDTRRRSGVRARARLYLMLNKPSGVISTARDPGGRANVVDMVRAAVPAGDRVYPVGRLDADSTGLVLLTNDGELAHRLAHPSSRHREGIPRRRAGCALERSAFAPRARRVPRRHRFAERRREARATAGSARPPAVKDRRRGDLSLVSVTLREGQNREIRRLFARVGLKVKSLERVALGALKLGKLPHGHFRALRNEEILALRRAVDLG